jgi:hypothetical protein
MADYPLDHGKCEGIMASEMYKEKSYTKWVMGLPNPTGPVLKYKKYILARHAASSSPEPPATPGAGPSSPVPPTTPPPSPTPPGADPRLLRKLDRLERKVEALTELVRCLTTGEEPPSATDVTPDVTPEVPEASTLATLA